MNNFCNPNCDDAQIRSYPVPCKRTDAIMKGGSEYFILLDCDVVFTDITDEAEWQALKDAGNIVVSPAGIGKIIKPEQKKERLTACGAEEVVDEVSGYEFFTSLLDKETLAHFDFLEDIKAYSQNKQLMWVECDGNLYHRYNFATGESPGFSGLGVEAWRESETDNLQKINTNFKWNTTGDGVKAIPLTKEISDILFA